MTDQERKDLLPQTPSQTVGPFFHFGLIFAGDEVLTSSATRGERMVLTGTVFDGAGDPLPDALLEIWQADADGHFAHPADPDAHLADPAFRGFGRSQTDTAGQYRFETVKPGALKSDDGTLTSVPHVNLRVFARGMLTHLVTRVFFDDEPGTAEDPLLSSVAAERRDTLVARREHDAGSGNAAVAAVYRFDVRLQGEAETVFFEP